jgi:hypothetical protein
MNGKILKPMSAVISIVAFLGSTFSSTISAPLWAEDDKKGVWGNSTALNPIVISNGQILSRALLLDSSLLFDVKQLVQNGSSIPTVQASLEELLLQANLFVSLRATSVVEKKEVPPSGDKHHFLSLAPYRWPDTSKPNGLPYVNRDGRVNPEVYSIPDKKNMDDLVYRVKILSLAYHLTDNPRYASKAAELLRVWFLNNSTYMHPNLQHAEMVRGENNGTMRGILHGKYLPEVIGSIKLLQQSPSWSKQDQEGIELWFSRYLDWLLYSDHGKEERRGNNNHATWYGVQVSAIALFLNKTHFAKSILQDAKNLIEQHIEPDGSLRREIIRRNSFDYSIFELLGLFRLASLGERFGIDLWNHKTPKGAGLQTALDYLLPSILGEELWPHSQIKLIDRKNMVDLSCRAAIHYQNNPTYNEACRSASAKDINVAFSHPP